MTEDLKAALAYFTNQSVYPKLFKVFREKFESYGRLSGAVKIDRYTEDELQELALFIGISEDALRKKKTLKLIQFEQALKATNLGNVTLLEILEAYYKESFVSKKDKAQQQLDEENSRMSNWRIAYHELADWFDVVEARTMDVQWILRLMRESDFEQKLSVLNDAIRLLPSDYVRLPFFSQRVTGNPHTFDLHTVAGKLLLHVLRVNSREMASTLSSTEEVNELLLKHYILRDDLSNDVSVANVIGYTNDTVHPMWQVACETKSAWNVPLREVLKVDKVHPAIGNRVYIVENSGVFSTLLDAEEEVPLVCTHGQFKLAALKVMDMLVIAGAELYYAGDFDPEGLNMAQRLLDRYPEACYLWRMDVDSYNASRPTGDITNRLNKLASIQHPLLMPIADQMKQSGRAGYQEALLEKYVVDLNGLNKR
jgi:uncharacterized protein (TIGR02679 family)